MKLFGTDGIRGVAGRHPITPETVLELGKSLVTLISEKKPADGEKTRIAIGRDTRISGSLLEESLISGITSSGADAALLGIIPSNAVSNFICVQGCDAGVMISASHNPPEQNGLKFFNAEGFKFTERDEDRLEEIFSSKAFVSGDTGSVSRVKSAKEDYVSMIAESLGESDLSGLKMAVDPCNGAASGIVRKLFSRLKCDTVIINNDPDGNNVNNGGTLFPEKLQSLVKDGNFDAGIALDGDADRLVMTDENGNALDGDSLIGIAAIHLQKNGRLPENTVVVTNYSNLGLDHSLKGPGIKVLRVQTGDKFVSQALFENNYAIGGESSGHIVFPEFSRTADALIAAVQILVILKESGKKLSELASSIKKYPQVMVNVAVREKKNPESMPPLMAKIKESEKNLGSGGRVFVRYSGTESKLRILVEGKEEKELKRIAAEIAQIAESLIGESR